MNLLQVKVDHFPKAFSETVLRVSAMQCEMLAPCPFLILFLFFIFCTQQKRKLRLYISNTFNPAKPDAEDSDGSIASWELRVEGKLLDDVSQWVHKACIHSHIFTPVAGVVQMFTKIGKSRKNVISDEPTEILFPVLGGLQQVLASNSFLLSCEMKTSV